MFLHATNIGIVWVIVSMVNLRLVGKFHVDVDARVTQIYLGNILQQFNSAVYVL